MEHEDLWCCIEPSDNKPIKASKVVNAKAKLILLLDPQNYVHVQDCSTAKEVWECLQQAFDDKGLTRRVGLLKDLINTKLESSYSLEEYVSKIINTAHNLRNIDFDVNNEWLGTLMLTGLPDEYKPMIILLESSGSKLKTEDQDAIIAINKVILLNYVNNQRTNRLRSIFAHDLQDDWLYNVTEPTVKSVTVANREPLTVKGVGCVDIQINQKDKIQVKNVLFVPGLAANLLSVSTIVKNEHNVIFYDKGCDIQNAKGEVICNAVLKNNLYVMNISGEEVHLTSSAVNYNDTYLWHLRMGHLNFSDIKKVPNCVEGMSLTLDKDKMSVLDTFKDFKSKVENELNCKIKKLRTDNGKEYCNNNFEKFLTNHGIIHQTSTPNTPEHNGLAERMNRKLVERARSLATAAYIVNRSPTKALEGKTPNELWKGKKPNLSHLKIFGSVAMVHVPKEKRQKWDRQVYDSNVTVRSLHTRDKQHSDNHENHMCFSTELTDPQAVEEVFDFTTG
ncbi:uncharacterized protein LOC130902919 [Diorhabda carinulata]|uniref:uncharacterized protein LOC130902919 n=1 Tax=Diorhabda carinulata TaxID=1163345 RepID=UPI0025A1B473|nr:uncharacterized protein LOC130902919 [Diorhabda carinulata]